MSYWQALAEGFTAWPRLMLVRFMVIWVLLMPSLGWLAIYTAGPVVQLVGGALLVALSLLILFLLVRFALVDSVVVLDGASPFSAWRRAAALTAGQRLSILGTAAVLFVLIFGLAVIGGAGLPRGAGGQSLRGPRPLRLRARGQPVALHDLALPLLLAQAGDPGPGGPRGHVTEPAPPRAPRLPVVGWLGGWPISIVSLALGLAALLVFRRGLPHVGWIVGYLLLLWLLFVLITELRAPLLERGRGIVLTAADYTIQTLYHNLLLFVLPAYYAAATLDSPNVIFLAAVAAGALVTAIDPLYRRLVHPRPWLNHALLGFSIFAALNVALPLVGVRPIMALEGSAVLAALALGPAFRRGGAATWWRAHARALGAAVVALGLVWAGRILVPPAPLFLAHAAVARGVSRDAAGRARRGRPALGRDRARVGRAGGLHRGVRAGRGAPGHRARLVPRPSSGSRTWPCRRRCRGAACRASAPTRATPSSRPRSRAAIASTSSPPRASSSADCGSP